MLERIKELIKLRKEAKDPCLYFSYMIKGNSNHSVLIPFSIKVFEVILTGCFEIAEIKLKFKVVTLSYNLDHKL